MVANSTRDINYLQRAIPFILKLGRKQKNEQTNNTKNIHTRHEPNQMLSII